MGRLCLTQNAMRYSLIPLLLILTIASKLPLSEANAQMLWNPPVGAFGYTVPDGSNQAEWLRSSVSGAGALWWNGTQNVVAADNASVAFEGTGVVGPASGTTSVTNSGRANTIVFRSLTGPYTLRLNPWLGNRLEVAAGVTHDVSLSGQIQFPGAGTRTIRNNGSALLHIANGFNRQLSGSGRTVVVDGSGPVRIDNNFVFRTDLNDNAQLIKNGSGRLELSHSTYVNLQAGITFNAGELYFSHPTAEIVSPSLTWNSGTLIYSLSNTVSNSNRQLIQGALTRSGSGPYVFDFQNTGTDRTYTLLLFQSTNFELSDFQAINVAPGGFFSWGSEQRGGVEYQSLRFTVTVPFDPGPEPDPEPEPQPETGPILSPTPVNLALNRPATSGPLWTEAYWFEPAYTPQRAFDGDTASDNSRWIGNGLPNWIEVDLGWNYQISGLRFWTGTASSPFPITGYNLQYWNGSSWTAIFSRTDSSNNGFEQVTFPPVVAGNRVRFNITALRDDNITRLYELEILGVVHDLYHTQLNPMSGGDLLDVAAPLQVVFSEAVEVGSVSAVVLRNLTANSEVPIVSVAVQGDTLSLLHGGLTPGHRYAVHLPPGAVSKSGQAAIQSGALYWEFQTLPAAPQVRAFPRDAVSVTADLRYTFDRDVTLVDGSGVRILLADDFSELAGVSVTLTDNRTLNIAHVPFVPGTRYIVDIPAGTVQGLHNGVVNNPIRRAFYSARFNLFSSDFDGSFDGFSTAAMLGAVPSNQSWALRTQLPGPGRDFTYIEASSRSDELDFLLSPMVNLRAGTEYVLAARASLGANLSVGLTALPNRSAIAPLAVLNSADSGPDGRTVVFTPEQDGDFHVIFYQTGGLANQAMQLDRIQLNRRVLPALEWLAPADSSSFTESEPVTLQVMGFAFGTGVQQVQFFDGSLLLGTASEVEEGMYAFTWNSRSPGVRMVNAVLTDRNGNTITRGIELTVTFNDGTLPPFVEWNFNGSAQGWTLGTFTHGNNRLNVGANWQTTHPWASSPVVFLRAGETYTLEFKARITTSGDNTFQMRANALTQTGFPTLDQRVGQMEFTVRPFPGPGGREFETIRRTFTVPEDGAYHITFYPHTNAGSLFLGIQIDDVRIIGDLNAAPSATWNSPTADVRTLAGTDILLRADPVDSDGFITRVAFVTAAGELLTAQADLSAAPWEYVWQDVPEGEYEVFIYVEDNAGGFALSGPRRITVLPNTLNISTYLGSADASESFTGAAHQSDGTIVLTGIMDPQLLPGNPPVLHLNGAQSGDRGVVVRLSGDAQTVLSVSVVSEQVLDVALDAQDRIYVAAGSRGAVVLSPDGTQVLFNETYGTRLAHRIDAAPGGAFALVASTQTDWRDERTGNTTIPIYDANWVLQSNLGGPAFTRDVAICEVNEVVVLIGFKNITDMDMPPTSSQFGELNPVDIPIMIGRNFNGTLRWRGYDWERFIDNPSRHLNNPTNNMADTRGHRVIIGPDGHIYAAFEFDGGNHPLRYSPLDVNESVQHLIVGGDNFFNTANTGTLPKVFVGRYRVQTGEMLLGQQLINRNPGNVESTLRIKNGALFVDTSRFIHLSGTSASGLPMTVEPLVGVNYSGGAWYMVLSPDMRSRELVTRFGSGGFNTFPSNAALSVSPSGQSVLAGFSESPVLMTHNPWQAVHSNPVSGKDALLTVGSFGSFYNFQTGVHPRLFFDTDELAEIRSRLEREPFASMLGALLANLNQGDFYRPLDENDPRARALRANGLAYAYALTGDDAFAAAARADIEFIFEQISPSAWVSTSRAGLDMYAFATHLAIAYDLCAHSAAWDPGFNLVVSRRLVDLANVIVDNGGSNQPNNIGSNWHAARGSSAGLAFLATDHSFSQARLDASWNRVNQYLALNRGNRPSVGWNPEGFGYTAYPFGLMIGPYGIAQARADATRNLRNNPTMQAKARSGFITATTAFNVYGTGGIKPDWSNDNAHIGGEGIFGQAFAYAPESWLPSLRWAYDRLLGSLAPHGGHWDSVRHGSFWSILFYPEQVTTQNPMEFWDWHIASNDAAGLGLFTFRNAYHDADDVLIQFKARLFSLDQTNWGPDGLGFRVIGLGESFVVGGGRNNPGLKSGQPTVYRTNPNDPDSFVSNQNTGTVVGQPVIKPDGGGHAIAHMQVSNVTTTHHKRWFVTDFNSAATGAEAVMVVADTSDDGLWWQLPTFLNNTITHSGNQFTITGVNGATLRGTILHPGGTPIVSIGTRERGSGYMVQNGGTLVEVSPDNPLITGNRHLLIQSSGDGDFLVVMTLQPEGASHPVVTRISGGVADAVIQVGARQYSLQPDNVLYDGQPFTPPAALVTFNVGNGGTLVAGSQTQSVPYGTMPVEPMIIAGEGFTFLGWDRPIAPVVRPMTFNAVFLQHAAEADGFDAWISRFDGIPEHLRGATDSAAGDGVANLLRFAFGMDPTSPSRVGMPELETDGNYLILRYRVSKEAATSGLLVQPLRSVDLSSTGWQPVDPASISSVGFDDEGNELFMVAMPHTPGPVFLTLRIENR